MNDAAVEIVAVPSPDRLARRYAYQVLLLEEFHRAGVEVAFLQRPISENPSDQLLLQIQGDIAEYERAGPGPRLGCEPGRALGQDHGVRSGKMG